MSPEEQIRQEDIARAAAEVERVASEIESDGNDRSWNLAAGFRALSRLIIVATK
ncbi:MAG: hypothetical protein NUW01_10745 [Gemmatimonadaceae bacterium]|nr:hypothetical protein [Gemmatimonadaceae bacterium]